MKAVSLVRFRMLQKNKNRKGTRSRNLMGFPGILLVDQTKQKFCRFESVLQKKRVNTSRALLLTQRRSRASQTLAKF